MENIIFEDNHLLIVGKISTIPAGMKKEATSNNYNYNIGTGC